MKALVLKAPGALQFTDLPQPVPGPNQVLLKLRAAALNRRDQFIREGKYPNVQLGVALGSDGVGEVVATGDAISSNLIGEMVLINPNINWGPKVEAQSREYNILGMPTHGTFAEYLAIDASRVHAVPSHLTPEQGAAIPLGSLTAYRACFHHGQIQPGHNVLISGFGGGVAQFAFQFSKAMGAHTYITSSSDDKINTALKMGAAGGFNYKNKDWYKNLWQTNGGFDVVIDSAGGNQINDFIKVMRPAGKIIFYGATNGKPSEIDLYRMFWNQITLQGSTMGNDEEFVQMLSFIEEHKIVPLVDSITPFDDIIKAFDTMASAARLGKLVVKF